MNNPIPTVHIVCRKTGGVYHRYQRVLNDQEFQTEVLDTLAEFNIGGLAGWKFLHIPEAEWMQPSMRVQAVLRLPVVEERTYIRMELYFDILRQHPNHTPCPTCSDRTYPGVAYGREVWVNNRLHVRWMCNSCYRDYLHSGHLPQPKTEAAHK